MKNTAINTVGYTGIVTLSQCTGTKKVVVAKNHNAGSYSLFNFFADCLCGNFTTAKYSLPARILLMQYDAEEAKKEGNIIGGIGDALTGYITRMCPPEKCYDEAAGVVKFSFVIPRAYVEAFLASGVGTKKICIGLYPAGDKQLSPSYKSDYLALCTLDLVQEELATTATLILDWELRINNAVGESIESGEYV